MIAAVINQSHVPLRALEKAVVIQVNRDVSRHWPVPRLSFGPNGRLHVLVTTRKRYRPYSPVSYGWHGTLSGGICVTGTHKPGIRCAVVFTDVPEPWRVTFSHEIVEALTDPAFNGHEIVDPTTYTPYSTTRPVSYRINGVSVADFVFPSYFTNGPSPYDQARRIGQPF